MQSKEAIFSPSLVTIYVHHLQSACHVPLYIHSSLCISFVCVWGGGNIWVWVESSILDAV